ncbi:hypothetical protein ACHFCA_13835 [Delftia tsuruhatensis]
MPRLSRCSLLSRLAVLCALAAWMLVVAGLRASALPEHRAAAPGARPAAAGHQPGALPAVRALQGFKGLARGATAHRWRAGRRR